MYMQQYIELYIETLYILFNIIYILYKFFERILSFQSRESNAFEQETCTIYILYIHIATTAKQLTCSINSYGVIGIFAWQRARLEEKEWIITHHFSTRLTFRIYSNKVFKIKRIFFHKTNKMHILIYTLKSILLHYLQLWASTMLMH